MADIGDKASKLEQEDLERRINAARHIETHRDGPYYCVKCGNTNDNRKNGLAICCSCKEEMENAH